jgi:hypothetical protein
MRGTPADGAGGVRAADHDPALAFRDRAAFLDANLVALFETVVFVVGGVFLRAHDEFLVDGMHDAALDADDHGLVALVAHHHTVQDPLGHVLRFL